jgi:integrase
VVGRSFEQRHRALLYTAAWTGCRWDELTGLLKDNLNLAEGELHIRSVAERISSGRVELKAVAKTQSSWRTITLPSQLVEVLKFQVAHIETRPSCSPTVSAGSCRTATSRRATGIPLWRTPISCL